jgi:hypothetical protein
VEVTDVLVLVLTLLLAVGVLGWTGWSVWHIARHTSTRQRASTLVLGSIAGTTLLGVVVPAALKGAFDPFPIWLIYAALTVTATAVLAWRWPVLAPGNGSHPSLVITAGLLLAVMAMAAVAVT